MYGEVEFQTGGGRRLVVPQTAVLNSGDRQTVFVDRGKGYFEPREVKSQSKAGQRREAADRRLALKPLKHTMDRWEREVARLHGEIEKIDVSLASPSLYGKEPGKAETLAKERADATRKLESAEHAWIEAAERFEAAQDEKS